LIDDGAIVPGRERGTHKPSRKARFPKTYVRFAAKPYVLESGLILRILQSAPYNLPQQMRDDSLSMPMRLKTNSCPLSIR
jgi:hypothetical protein